MKDLHLHFLLFCLVCFFSLTFSQLPPKENTTIYKLSNLLNLSTPTTNPCSWPFINCSRSPTPHITSLRLSSTATPTTNDSTLFSLLCSLPSLNSLDLSNNSLTSVPSCFSSTATPTTNDSTLFNILCSLPSLNSLDFSHNSLTSLPSCLSSLTSLTTLNLSFNLLSGSIPALPDSLQYLILSNNNFDGPFPDLRRCRNLTLLDLSFNLLSGSIPALPDSLQNLSLSNNNFDGPFPDLLKYPNLTLLDLSNNELAGSVPASIGQLSKLHTLVISSNNLKGAIPASLSNIANLSRFSANQNKFSGSVPVGIVRHMQLLDLSYNNLSGEIPADLLSGVNLRSVDLTANNISGNIPVNMSARNLYRLRLGQNLLNGSIPQAIGNLARLIYLELDGNRLEDKIPAELGKCKNLSLLNLGSNRLSGQLPQELGGLQQLVVIELENNRLTGEIPVGLFRLGNLSILNLSSNLLTGQIPDSISSASSLSVLNLEGNKLNGSIPPSVGQCQKLIELQLGSNQLSGAIPQMPGTLTTALNLSSNQLSGSIPSSLGGLEELEVLDLSDNNLTGNVPSTVTDLRSLTQVDISNNKLSGVRPKFTPRASVNAAGNQFVRDNGSTGTYSPKKNHNVLIIIVSILGALAVFGLAIAVFALMVWKRSYSVEAVCPQSEENPLQIINGCLLTSNNAHKSSIDFTKALEETDNPANVMFKTRFSTYYNADMPNGTRYSVKKVNLRDKIFPTGSRAWLRKELEALGKLSSSNIMAPLAYVLTGESAYLFYDQVHKGTLYDFLHKGLGNALDWSSRYNIALGVAHGLAFLHSGAQPVLLLDLTSKSIHLKSLTEPQIGDIELCKVIDPTKSIGSLSTVAGSVGYIPPEYAYTMRLTMSGNVYSFGVILLELLTGKPPVGDGIELAKWALSYSSKLDEREQILDSKICRTSMEVRNQMLSVLKIALECVNFSPDARPKTRNVLRMLFNTRQV